MDANCSRSRVFKPCTRIVTTIDRTNHVVFTLGEMRKSLFIIEGVGSIRVLFVRFTCLLALAVVPLAVFAGTTQANLTQSHHVHRRVHTVAHHGRRHRSVAASKGRKPVRTNPGKPSPHKTLRASYATHSRRVSHTRRTASMARRSKRKQLSARNELSAKLDTVRTHSTPVGVDAQTSTEGMDTPVGSQMAMSKPVTLLEPSSTSDAVTTAGGAVASTDAARRDLSLFNTSVPSYMPVPLRGSHEVLVHQNIIADVEGLGRIQNDAQLGAMVHSGELVALPASSALTIDPRLPFNRRYCRPWTAKFLGDISRAHDSVFGHPLLVTSAVRTVDFQRHLARYNGNAAPAFGDTASPHLTGQAIDIGKKGMSQHEIAWMRAILGHLQNSGRLDVEEEFEQACFHISVYKTYAPRSAAPEHLIASDAMPATEVPAKPAIGALTRPVRVNAAATHSHSYYVHNARRVAAHRRRRRHHSSMSLLAVRMR